MPFNVSRHLREAALRRPRHPAVILPDGRSISLAQLDAECDRFADAFYRRGVRAGMRVAVFIKPGFSFVPTIFGCFRLGAIPICIDPGMKLKNILACVEESAPAAIIGIRRARILARFFPRAFRSVRLRLSPPRVIPGVIPTARFTARPTKKDDEAAILFTSGSTGIPKGVVYTHGAFDGQQAALRDTYGIGPEEIDLVVFPLFALFSAAWGITAVIPRMNPARPARAKGDHLASLILKVGVTHTAGSPAIWKNLVAHCESRAVVFPSLKRILMAGAQVPESLVLACAKIAAEVHTPYGATEALPLTTIDQTQLSQSYPRTRLGEGTCVGQPLPGVEMAILPSIEGPIRQWEESLRQPPYTRGEVAVRAPWITANYFGRNHDTAKSKIESPEGLWHRMGDVGYLDDRGNLWFCGRKDHRIFTRHETLYPDPIEAIFDRHPSVLRSAVVGVGPKGRQRAILVVQGKLGVEESESALRQHGDAFPLTRSLEKIVFTKTFPLDVRHNIKIDRLKLAQQIEGTVS